MLVTYNDERHEYRYGGVVIPSVTQCIAPLYSGAFDKIPQAVLERKTEIGKAVHLATELYDEGVLEESSLDDVVRGYFEGWKKFTAEHKCEWLGIEERVFHPSHKYAGKLDRKGFVDGRLFYIDIKTVSVVCKATGVQLAGYLEADSHMLPFNLKMMKPRRAAIQLKPDGRYEWHEFEDANDWPTFISCLTIKRFTS